MKPEERPDPGRPPARPSGLLVSFIVFMRVGPDHSAAALQRRRRRGPRARWRQPRHRLHRLGDDVSAPSSRAVEAIYTRNDLDLLLSSPLSPWRMLIVRSSAIAIGALPLYAGLLGPPLLWLAVFSSPLWLSAIVFLVTLAFAATGIALLIVTGALPPDRAEEHARAGADPVGRSPAPRCSSPSSISTSPAAATGPMTPGSRSTALITQLNIDPHVWWLFPARAMTGDLPATFLWIAGRRRSLPARRLHLQPQLRRRRGGRLRHGPPQARGADARVAAVRGGVDALGGAQGIPPAAPRSGAAVADRAAAGLSPAARLRPAATPAAASSSREAAFAPALTLLSSALSRQPDLDHGLGRGCARPHLLRAGRSRAMSTAPS